MSVMSEGQLQELCMQWVGVKRLTDERYWLVFAVPNGGKKPVATRIRHMKDGLLPGVSDVLVMCPSGDGVYHGACLELKTAKGRLSQSQELFLKRAHENGMFTMVIRSFDDFVKALEGYFGSEV